VALLTLAGVSAGYGRAPVIADLDLTVAPGEMVVLLGPNGAGKSTVLKAVFGLARTSAGRIVFADRAITGWRPADCLAAGIALVPQGGQVFGPLSVAENLALARAFHPAPAAAPTDLPPALRAGRRRAGTLSGGERGQLALAMALSGQPRLLLVDEPSIGLAPAAAREALRALALRRDRDGLALLLVEQNVALALEFADRALLLVSGRCVAQAPTAAIRADEALRRQFTFGLAEPDYSAPAGPMRSTGIGLNPNAQAGESGRRR